MTQVSKNWFIHEVRFVFLTTEADNDRTTKDVQEAMVRAVIAWTYRNEGRVIGEKVKTRFRPHLAAAAALLLPDPPLLSTVALPLTDINYCASCGRDEDFNRPCPSEAGAQ